MTNVMHDPVYRGQLARELSHDGRFQVIFGHYPDDPEIFEFVSAPVGGGKPIRYINLDARPGAKTSRLIRI